MDLALTKKAFIVTGGSDGLGAAAARALLAEGARVTICARDSKRLLATAAALAFFGATTGGQVLALQADVTVPADLERLVAATVERWGRLDGVLNNAGQAAARSFEAVTDEAWQHDLDLKLAAATRLSRLALEPLRQSGGGSILNVLAIGAKHPAAASLPSSVSRAAGMALTKAMSRDLGADNIRVNAILIGLVESGQWQSRAKQQNTPIEALYDNMSKGIPLGRIGKAEEFGDLVAFLFSERAAYISGTAINFDGGLSFAV
jgi:NAD(P)-dependent dehydrogenase (short-subunit alcohol dehydrogenase family)